jgi:hypothetical protein
MQDTGQRGAAITHQTSPNGYFLLQVGGHRHVIIGGPFDAFNGGFGVCLDKHSSKAKDADLLLDVPDFGIPPAALLEKALVTTVDFMLHRPDVPVFVGCRGGIGRTGMFMAALVRSVGVDTLHPVEWVRSHYLRGAVETSAQRGLVMAINTKPVWDLILKDQAKRTPPIDLHEAKREGIFSRISKYLPWH